MKPIGYVRLRCRECVWSRYHVAYSDEESDGMHRDMREALDEHQGQQHGGRAVVTCWTGELTVRGVASGRAVA